MIPTREALLRSLESFDQAAQLEILLSQTPPSDQVARLLRNGLTVVGFCILEEYVRARCIEVAEHISKGPASFSDLPLGLQKAATEGAVGVLASQVRFHARSGEDPIPLIQQVGRALSSTSSASLELSTLTLQWEGSNLSASDLKDILANVGVDADPWGQMTALAMRAGFPIQGSLRDVFVQCLKDRNAAAHAATSDIPVLRVRSFSKSALAIAFAFDVLISRAARLCYEATADYLRGSKKFRQGDIPLRFLDYRGSDWAEYVENKLSRAVRRQDSLDVARSEAMQRARDRGETVVIRDRNRMPTSWVCADLP
jgi:hypothetical protein